MGDYRYDPSVDMSGYVPLAKRVKNACRCSICSADPEIRKYYENDFLCKHDGLSCDLFSDDLGAGLCSWKVKNRVHFCSRFKGNLKF